MEFIAVLINKLQPIKYKIFGYKWYTKNLWVLTN